MKKILVYLKVWGDDYTAYIYILRILGYALTLMYFIFILFDKKKTGYFNRKVNFFVRERKKQIQLYNKPFDEEFNQRFLKDNKYDFNGIYLPKIENTYLLRTVYNDVLKIYVEKNDNYNYKIVDELDKILPEGSYCYVGPNGEDITIKEGYVVIDAGAWIGDFSAYASKKKAHVFSFEPSPINIKLLEKTVEYNSGGGGDITIVPYGLGDKEEVLDFLEIDDDGNSANSSFNKVAGDANIKLDVTTIDTWVEKNNIRKVDFIKADIEGYERKMLLGAMRTLKELEPILSICTYHLPDDPKVLKEIILKANSGYKIIQRKMKLFAYVDKS